MSAIYHVAVCCQNDFVVPSVDDKMSNPACVVFLLQATKLVNAPVSTPSPLSLKFIFVALKTPLFKLTSFYRLLDVGGVRIEVIDPA